MSPQVLAPREPSPRFPRVSGDEPSVATFNPDSFSFSPRERG